MQGKGIVDHLKRLSKDEDGAPSVESILIIALIVVPLVMTLVFYGDKVVELVKEAWDKLKPTQGAS